MQINSGKKPFMSKILDYKTRAFELSIGFFTKDLTDKAFDYLLYPFVIYHLGILKGGIVMTLLSFIACILTMKFYDWSKRDWLGIEAIKRLKGYEGSKKLGKVTAWSLKKSEPVIFLFLSIQYDPFITTAYLRHGKFSGMTKRDWKIFTGSLLIANTYWTLACYMGISLVEWGLKTISK